MQSAGEVCVSCEAFWQSKGKVPRILEDTGFTTRFKGIPIVLCGFCDGSVIFERRRKLDDGDNGLVNGIDLED